MYRLHVAGIFTECPAFKWYTHAVQPEYSIVCFLLQIPSVNICLTFNSTKKPYWFGINCYLRDNSAKPNDFKLSELYRHVLIDFESQTQDQTTRGHLQVDSIIYKLCRQDVMCSSPNSAYLDFNDPLIRILYCWYSFSMSTTIHINALP